MELNKAVEINPKYLKAIARRAEAFYELASWSQAVDDYEKCLEAEPNNKDFIDKLKKSREKMLSSKDFQTNEKRSMKKVEIQEDSSDGEDVDFGDAGKAKKEKDNSNSESINGSISTKTANANEPIIEKMTEDEQDSTYLNNITSTNNDFDPLQKMKEQEVRVKNFISQYSSQEESSTVNLMSITKPIATLREAFEKMYITYVDEKNKCLEVMKTGDYTKCITDYKMLIRNINADNIEVAADLEDLKNQFILKIYGNLSLAFYKSADYKNCLLYISKALNN